MAPSNFQPPSPTIEFVPNPYYSFPYIATSFGNARACSQAIGQCSDSFQACTSQLGGQAGAGDYHVTVVVPGGGGTTVTGNGGINYGPASATSICEYSQSHLGIPMSMCANRFPLQKRQQSVQDRLQGHSTRDVVRVIMPSSVFCTV